MRIVRHIGTAVSVPRWRGSPPAAASFTGPLWIIRRGRGGLRRFVPIPIPRRRGLVLYRTVDRRSRSFLLGGPVSPTRRSGCLVRDWLYNGRCHLHRRFRLGWVVRRVISVVVSRGDLLLHDPV